MTDPDPPLVAKHNLQRLFELHQMMIRIRCFEEAAMAAFEDGEIIGSLHLSIGQEAVPAGICINLRGDDRLTSTHRGHGHVLAKGADPVRMMAELHGRENGYCGGKGGSMHLADFSVGMLGANGIVAGGIPIAVGAAQGLKLMRSDAIVVCMFGDGAINRGPFLEGLNWAAVYELPVLFVCEDNRVSAFTNSASVTAGAGVAARATAIGVPATTVDGNDVLAVDRVATDAVASVRRGDGPRLIHAVTYRLKGHVAQDQAGWRSASDVSVALASEPIARIEAVMRRRGVHSDQLAQMRNAADSEMKAARHLAREAAWPAQHLAFSDVQDAIDSRFPSERES